jgi:hypothetical protein
LRQLQEASKFLQKLQKWPKCAPISKVPTGVCKLLRIAEVSQELHYFLALKDSAEHFSNLQGPAQVAE